MHSFLCTYLYWPWNTFHWMRNHIYAPWTFGAFVFIGFAQTAIAWESGELTVKALTRDLLSYKLRKRCLRLVRTLAILLLPATIFIGIVNDKNQRDADDRANVARADESAVQAKLDEANKRAKHAQESFDAFAQSLDPSKLTVAQYVRLIQANQDAFRAAGATPSHEIKSPFSSMKNADLRDAIRKFVNHVHFANHKMYSMVDEVEGEEHGIQMAAEQKHPAQQDLIQSLQANQQALNAFTNSIVQSDVPIANSYLRELLRRLGPQNEEIPPFTAVPDASSINNFDGRVEYLETLAERLPK